MVVSVCVGVSVWVYTQRHAGENMTSCQGGPKILAKLAPCMNLLEMPCPSVQSAPALHVHSEARKQDKPGEWSDVGDNSSASSLPDKA